MITLRRLLERAVLIAAGGVCALLALDTARRVVLPRPMDRCGPRHFSADCWRDSSLAQWPRAVRGCMVDDLLRRGLLRGRTREQVVALLGEPPPTHGFRDYDLVYWLGPERGFISIDSEWLAVRLGGDGRVEVARVLTD